MDESWLVAQESRIVWVKACYFDASALVKLSLDEARSGLVRAFVNGRANLFTNSLCYAEGFGVLKRKWLKRELAVDAYFQAVRNYTREVENRMRFETWTG